MDCKAAAFREQRHCHYILFKQKVTSFLFFMFFTVDQIYHLASPASPPNYMYNPIKTLKTNTIGTLNMLGERLPLTVFI